ncbi:hypothetical protein DFH07DRAFT_28242 [Mycena maculata]|uniref:Uncharacterized protein n=1 Tax=Mycena maculata TaxID=230809 RepID=A0AAD7IKJ7_9AGAR|nr:hypothetical protein DFH07DRAFT_28242 [Mycena maculata]
MDHPYSRAASYAYSDEPPRKVPGAAPKHPYPRPLPTPAPPPYQPQNSNPLMESASKAPLPSTAADAAPARPHEHARLEPLRRRSHRKPVPYHTLDAETAAELKSGWVDDEADDDPRWPVVDAKEVRANDDSETHTSNETMVPPPMSTPQLKFKSTVVRFEGTDNAPGVPRPEPVPYEQRPSERALAARKHAAWRKKIIDIMCV